MYKRSELSKSVALAIATGSIGISNYAIAQESGAEGRRLEEVIVTATRRESGLQDAPIAVSVFDESAIDALEIASFNDYLKYSPNIKADGAQPGTQFTEMRGIGGYGGNIYQAGTIGAKASVAVYLDETPVSAGASGTRNVDLYVTDINRIEVLAGPQGTLFGSASLSGAIRLISNKPVLDEFDLGVEASTGSTEGSSDMNYSFEGFVNVPVIENKLGVRLAAYNSYSAGYFDNTPGTQSLEINRRVVGDTSGTFDNTTFGVFDNDGLQQSDMNEAEYAGARLSATFAINDNWTLFGQYTQQQLDTEGTWSYRGDLGDLEVERYKPEYLDDQIALAAWSLEGRVAALDLIYSGSYFDREVDQVIDYSQYTESGGFLPYYICDFPDYTVCEPPDQDSRLYGDYRNVTHELRASYNEGERFNWVAGVYYHENGCSNCGTSIEFNYYGSIAQGFPQNSPMPGAIDYNPDPRPFGTMFFTDMKPTVDELSFFGDVSYFFTDKFSASIGLRNYDIQQDAVGSVNFGSRSNPASGVNFSDNLRRVDESDTISKITLTYNPWDSVNFYGTRSEGFSTGGYNRTGGTIGFDGSEVPLSYDTETTTNYEIGWKTQLLDNRLRFNGALYRIEWDNIVVGILDLDITNALFFINAGEAEVNGLEADVVYLLNDNWTITAAATLTDSELTYVAPGSQNIVPVGSELARQPKFAGNARARYDFQMGGANAYAMLGAVYTGEAWSGLSPSRDKMDAYTVFDANFGIAWQNGWGLRLYAQNFTDERYDVALSTNEATDQIFRTIGRPRTIGVSVTYDLVR